LVLAMMRPEKLENGAKAVSMIKFVFALKQ